MVSMTTSVQGRANLPSIDKADSLLIAGDNQSVKEMYSKVSQDTSENDGALGRSVMQLHYLSAVIFW